jgi:hypothetical protein
MTSAELDAAKEELTRTFTLPAYEAFDVVWIAVIKLANLLPGKEEHDRLLALLDRLSEDSVRDILQRRQVDTLLNLQPPLETVRSSEYERLNAGQTADNLEMVRRHRADDPKLALRNLAEVLKRIRNRRAHGYKTPEGRRDKDILESAVELLRLVGFSAVKALDAERRAWPANRLTNQMQRTYHKRHATALGR